MSRLNSAKIEAFCELFFCCEFPTPAFAKTPEPSVFINFEICGIGLDEFIKLASRRKSSILRLHFFIKSLKAEFSSFAAAITKCSVPTNSFRKVLDSIAAESNKVRNLLDGGKSAKLVELVSAFKLCSRTSCKLKIFIFKLIKTS